MPTYTKQQLKSGTTASADIPASAQSFELKNDAGSIYFSIESLNNTFVFNTASVTGLTNCSLVSGSKNGAFIVNSKSTGSFTFTPTSVIPQEDIRFRATNIEVYSINDSTSSGSFFGIDLEY